MAECFGDRLRSMVGSIQEGIDDPVYTGKAQCAHVYFIAHGTGNVTGRSQPLEGEYSKAAAHLHGRQGGDHPF
ncbi:hypothetical protein E4Q23_22565 [Candidatus Accumulibacter phosphatis]|uniref:Uncharacterized protein n=1 Tax=Candidatus Accumulibacter phosphatis TaxID=327160 RepID=A0ABX1U5H9_9PROT|nr:MULTISPECIES: hypothetical protein [Candidatus Accumulibacter]NMQ30295.1 hypothetical protein [Candidatus Accumulibacter phosphatis]